MNHFLNEQNSASTTIVLALITFATFIFIVIFLKLNALSLKMIVIICGLFFSILSSLLLLDYCIFPQFRHAYRSSLPIQIRLAMKCLSQAHTLRRLSFVSIALALITILTIAHYEYALEKNLTRNQLRVIYPHYL